LNESHRSIVRNGMIEGRSDLRAGQMLKPEAGAARSEANRAAAFTELADRHLDASYRLAALLLGNWADAEDAAHDAAVLAWQRWPSLRDPARFEAWFQRILVNVCRDRMRRRNLRPNVLLADDPPGPDPFAGSAERAALRQALDRLGPDHRTVVVLRYFADLSVDEIAQRTGQRAGTVKSRLHYALSSLRAAYDAADRSPLEVVR
jgi:RNA polymerase sigma-70 factor, ECF subfamily